MSRVNAILVHRDGGPEELRYEAVEVGAPGPREAHVRHSAIDLRISSAALLISNMAAVSHAGQDQAMLYCVYMIFILA